MYYKKHSFLSLLFKRFKNNVNKYYCGHIIFNIVDSIFALLHCNYKINVELFYSLVHSVFLYIWYLQNFPFNVMFYNSGWLSVGNNNMIHRMVVDSGLHKTKFYDVFYHIKLTVAPLIKPSCTLLLTSFLVSFNLG